MIPTATARRPCSPSSQTSRPDRWLSLVPARPAQRIDPPERPRRALVYGSKHRKSIKLFIHVSIAASYRIHPHEHAHKHNTIHATRLQPRPCLLSCSRCRAVAYNFYWAAASPPVAFTLVCFSFSSLCFLPSVSILLSRFTQCDPNPKPRQLRSKPDLRPSSSYLYAHTLLTPLSVATGR